MPPFQYRGYSSPYVQSISALLEQPGQIEAQRAEQVGQAQSQAALRSGAAWSGAAQQAGSDISGAIQQYNDPKVQLERMQLAQVKSNQASMGRANQIVGSLMQPDGTIDVSKATQMMAAAGVTQDVQGDVLKHVDELHKIAQSYQADKVNHAADVAHTTIGMIDAGMDPFMAVAAGVGIAKSSGMASDQELAPVMSQIIQAPDAASIRNVLAGVRGLSEKYKDVDKPVVVPEGGTLMRPSTGDVVGKVAPKPTQPTEASLAFQLTDPDPAVRARAMTAMAALKPSDIKPGTVEDWVARSRALAAQTKGAPLTDQETMALDAKSIGTFKNLAKDPDVAALAQSNAELRNLMLKAQLDQQPTADDAKTIAQQLIDHKMAPSQLSLFGGFGSAGAAFKRMVGTEALKIDPNFDMEQSEADYAFSKTPQFQNTTRLMGSIQESMPRILENAKALGNADSQTINKAINEGKTEFNNVNLAKFKTDSMLVGDEIAKIMSGGGSGSGISDAKLQQAQSILSDAKDYKAMAATLQEVNDLIGFRRKTLMGGTYAERQAPAVGETSTKGPLPAGVTIQRH